METITVKLGILKETKNTVHYRAEDTSNTGLSDIYIRKSALPTPFPAEIEVTVKAIT